MRPIRHQLIQPKSRQALQKALQVLLLMVGLAASGPAALAGGSAGPSSTPSLGEAMRASNPEQLALAEFLRQSGMVFYGAWWCPACFKQKDLFGQQAGNRLPYVECDKDQPGRERCQAAEVKAYPTWVLKGERRVGVQTLEELKRWSGFDGQRPEAQR